MSKFNIDDLPEFEARLAELERARQEQEGAAQIAERDRQQPLDREIIEAFGPHTSLGISHRELARKVDQLTKDHGHLSRTTDTHARMHSDHVENFSAFGKRLNEIEPEVKQQKANHAGLQQQVAGLQIEATSHRSDVAAAVMALDRRITDAELNIKKTMDAFNHLSFRVLFARMFRRSNG